MKATIEGPYGEFAKMDAVKQVAMVRALKGRDEDVRVKTDELAAKDREIQQLRYQLEQAQVQIQRKNTDIDQIRAELQRRDEELQQKDVELQLKDLEFQQKDEELQRNAAENRTTQSRIYALKIAHQCLLEEKDECISQLQRQVENLQAELREAQTQVQLLGEVGKSSLEAQFAELEIPLKFQWKHGRNMNIGMSFYPQAVVLKGKVYVGGGMALIKEDSTLVMCYDAERNQWFRSSLPRYTTMYFAMTALDDNLLIVGGRHPTNTQTTRAIGEWNGDMQEWMYRLETLPTTGRDAATAITHDNKYLIVAGGRNDAYESLSRVDILDMHNSQRLSYSGSPLPQPAYKMTAAVLGNTLVLLGGSGADNEFHNKVFSVKLDELITEAVSSHGSELLASLWQTLPDTPVVSATVLAFNGALLAVGGSRPNDSNSRLSVARVHVFKPSTRMWVEAGQLEIDRWRCACAVLPSGEIFIAGGATTTVGQVQREVHIATLQ